MNRIPLRLGIAVEASRTIRSVGEPAIVVGTHGTMAPSFHPSAMRSHLTPFLTYASGSTASWFCWP